LKERALSPPVPTMQGAMRRTFVDADELVSE
jgi:hypothetical protein